MTDHHPGCALNEQASAFALYALEPDQELAVRAHLPRCASCQEAAWGAELVARVLAGSVEQVEPPARLRAAVLAGARSGIEPGPRPARVSVPVDPPPALRRRPPRRRRLAALLAAAVLAVGALAGYAAHLQQQRDSESARAQALGDLVTRQDAPGSTLTTLRDGGGAAVATVFATATERTVVVSGLRPTDPDRSVYVVWGIGAAAPLAIGTVDVTGPDPAVVALEPAPAGRPFLGYAISLEPGRSAPAVPTTVVASGS
jgi:anti-sigma-K factor RskA